MAVVYHNAPYRDQDSPGPVSITPLTLAALPLVGRSALPAALYRFKSRCQGIFKTLAHVQALHRTHRHSLFVNSVHVTALKIYEELVSSSARDGDPEVPV
jgi:hypothetical protein